eukprot:m.7839 g.7839  ORF g.7839 m.7839 type:complete len:269 (+) comp3789_c0_seq1:229-1035(+)
MYALIRAQQAAQKKQKKLEPKAQADKAPEKDVVKSNKRKKTGDDFGNPTKKSTSKAKRKKKAKLNNNTEKKVKEQKQKETEDVDPQDNKTESPPEEKKEDTGDDGGEENAQCKKQKVGTRQYHPSGVSWVDVEIGIGPQKPTVGRVALIHYTGYLGTSTNCPVFDCSTGPSTPGRDQKGTHPRKPAKPARLKVGAGKARNEPPFGFKYGKGKVIKGLEIGMKSMMEGGKRIIHIPPKLGYGKHGTRRVPPDSHLTFDLEFIRVGSKNV